MDIDIPVVPAGIILLLNFFAPYATAIVINPRWSDAAKKIVAIVVAIVLAAVVMAIAYFGFEQPLPSWPVLLLLAVAISQASYDLVTGRSADVVTRKVGVGRGMIDARQTNKVTNVQ